jgi:site-specific DNA recombinase
LPMSAVRKSSDKLKQRLAGIEDKLADSRGLPKSVRAVATAEDVRAAWETLDLDSKREIIRALAVVYVEPPGQGARHFDPETVKIIWR